MRVAMKVALLCIAVCLVAAPTAAQVQNAKLLGDGAAVALYGRMVTYAGSGSCYIQDDNGTAQGDIGGIRVVKTSYTFALGGRIDVSGTMRTDANGERYVECVSVTPAQPTSAEVLPWMMSNRSIGGSDWRYSSVTHAGQMGVTDGVGLNNIGLLLKAAGVVTYVDPANAFFYLDDGSALSDGNTLRQSGSPALGVRVRLAGDEPPPLCLVATTVGISSIEKIGGLPRRCVLARAVSVTNDFPLRSLLPMVPVPGGEFLMGNSGVGDDAADGYPREYPQHSVNVPTFWISKTEITRGQFRQFVNAGGYGNAQYWSAAGWLWRTSMGRTQPDYWAEQAYFGEPFGSFGQGDLRPVVGVSYYEAEAFCNWAGGRLPTEAEWEKAARWDGTPRVYPWGNSPSTNKTNDWFDTYYPGFQTSPVSSIGGVAYASPYGCTDMAGNVWEWTQDWFRSYPGSSSPFDRTGIERALRSGGWYGAYGNRCAARWFASPRYADSDVGFRIAY